MRYPGRTSSSFAVFFTFFAAFFTIFPLNASENQEVVVPQMTLREALEAGWLGIQKEPEPVHTALRQSARKYASWKRGIISDLEIEAWKKQCAGDGALKDDFCPLVLGQELIVKQPEEEELVEEDIEPDQVKNSREVVTMLKNADFSALKRATSSAIYLALRTFGQWSALEPIAKRALSESVSQNCDHPEIATALGQKAETFLPDPKYKQIAFSLYEKVLECKNSEHASRARFRYSLLKIMDQDCKTAEPILTKVYEENSQEYLGRTLYWRARCAQMRGDRMRFEYLSQKLLKEAPLGYHNLVLNRAQASKIVRVAGTGEPTIFFRSHQYPHVNSWIRAMEGLAAIGSEEYARRMLAKWFDAFVKTEPQLRLYLAVLANKLGDPITQFRFLTSVFKDKPDLISQTTLKLFYPLKNFESIKRHSGESDPYFIAALIRQESGFNPWARSRVGATGLMQLMPRTARMMDRGVTKNGLFIPETNIRLGTRYIHRLIYRFDRDAELALAAYNAGAEKVDDWLKRYSTNDRMLFLDLIPYKETRDYVVLISRNYYWYNTLYGAGMGVPMRSIASAAQPLLHTATAAPGAGPAPVASHEATRSVAGSQAFLQSGKKLFFTLFQ